MFSHLARVKIYIESRKVEFFKGTNIDKINMFSIDQIGFAEQLMRLFQISECSKKPCFSKKAFYQSRPLPDWLRENQLWN